MSFMPAARPANTRSIAPKHQAWIPLAYMERAVRFLCGLDEDGVPVPVDNFSAARALFLDPGLRKTSITLEAFRRMQSAGVAERMLVIAPLRVCQLVWPAEGRKWTQFTDLKFSFLHGDKKRERLADDADIFLINPEGVEWLCQQFTGRQLPFDTVVIDELTKFKNARSKRSMKLRPHLKGVRRRFGLTGTPAPNGYLDLFGQFLMLDDGAALGKFITHYRDQHFVLGFDGFGYQLMLGAAQRIEERIKPYVLRMSAEDYLTLPPLIEDVREIDLDSKARHAYETMRKQMIVELAGATITGANAAAVSSKLSQMANGAVYTSQGAKRETVHVHDAKLDALGELIEELAGQPLLVAYEFNHDLDRLLKRFPNAPYIGSGVNTKDTQRIEADWNANKVPVLFAHPASVGHGLNLQEGNAAHIAWFGPTWDLELWDQFNRRILRSGNTAARVVVHILVVKKSIDEEKLATIVDKDKTQGTLLARLRGHLDLTPPAGDSAANEESTEMAGTGFWKMNRQDTPQQQQPAQNEPSGPGGPEQPKGTGFFGKRETPPAGDSQRERVEERISGETQRPQEQTQERPAGSLFSKAVQERLDDGHGAGGAAQADPPPPTGKDEQNTGSQEAQAPAPQASRAPRTRKAPPPQDTAVQMGTDDEPDIGVMKLEIRLTPSLLRALLGALD